MKKMITFLMIISLIESAGLVHLGIKSRTTGIPIFSSKYIIKGKMYGEDADIREWATPEETAIKEEAKQFQSDNAIAVVTKTYDYLAEGYHYEQDDLIVLNNGHIVLKGGIDSWNLPIITLAIKHQNKGETWMDCEDGTFFLVSLLRANGVDAWANIGTITITDPETKQSSIYGHAWVTVIIDRKEYLLETTLGEPLKELRPVPNTEILKYRVDVKFNEKDVQAITGVDINKRLYPPLPPAKIRELKDALEKAK